VLIILFIILLVKFNCTLRHKYGLFVFAYVPSFTIFGSHTLSAVCD